MNLSRKPVTRMDLRVSIEPLSSSERRVADFIAECIKNDRDGGGGPFIPLIEEPIGLFIWKVCRQARVNHRKIARHLGSRRKR